MDPSKFPDNDTLVTLHFIGDTDTNAGFLHRLFTLRCLWSDAGFPSLPSGLFHRSVASSRPCCHREFQ
jgi:hypothetical protein